MNCQKKSSMKPLSVSNWVSTEIGSKGFGAIVRQKHYIFAYIIVLMVLIFVFSMLFHKTVSSASSEFEREQCYQSVEIQPGDSLWSIASRYFTEEWISIEHYIEEIKLFNSMESNEIHSGDYLMIPYYVEALQ